MTSDRHALLRFFEAEPVVVDDVLDITPFLDTPQLLRERYA